MVILKSVGNECTTKRTTARLRKDRISERMRRVRSKNTAPELTLRRLLREKGIRFSGRNDNLPGKPDLTLRKSAVAVFVDGDFWHGLQWATRGHASIEGQFSTSTTSRYWVEKIRRNMERDCIVTNNLVRNGWRVVRLWESDVQNRPEECIRKIMQAANRPRAYDEFAHIAEKSCAEFFAGIGLMRLGLEKAGWFIRFANDIDEQKFEIYRANFDCADGHFVREDIHKLMVEKIPTVALATASFPCNDLSLAGGRKGLSGSQSSAFWGFIDILEALGQRKPPIILLENVTGFLSSHGGRDFAEAMLALNRLNYAVDPFIMDAAWFVPQSRQRLFVVGTSKAFEPPRSAETQRFYESHVRPKALADFILQHSEIDWRIRKLPVPPRTSVPLPEIIEDPPPDSLIWWSVPRAKYLLQQMSAKHRETANRLIAGRGWSYGTVFRRVRNGKSMAELRTDGVAGCLRTPRGGSGRQILFKAGKGKYFVRLLTARECARLMGADDFVVDFPLNQALFGFGDAVCVPVIEWVAKYYLNPLVGELLRSRVLSACPMQPSRTSVAA